MSERGASQRPPRVTAVIASYRWPEALRLSLGSALAQTIDDIEVLVIEDGGDLASRAVTSEVGDPRVRWLSLEPGSGSQSGPNALGWREARAPVVAYLGHDDLWDPTHLAGLLAALTDPDVDVVHATTLMLTAGDDRARIAGGPTWDATTFVPPSSIAHRRDSPRIGRWPSPGDTGLPVDYAWLLDCDARGARFAATQQPTVFKFVAAWALDSYVTRDVRPHTALRDRLATDPGLGPAMLEAALADGVPPFIAAPPSFAPGVMADYNRRIKGLPPRFGPKVTRWTPDPLFAFRGWYPTERDEHGPFAWMGDGERAFVRLDAPGPGRLGVAVLVRHVVDPEQLDAVLIDVDGTVVDLEAGPPDERWAITLTGWLDRPAHGHTVEVGLTTARVVPSDRDPASRDDRALGLAIGEIRLLERVG